MKEVFYRIFGRRLTGAHHAVDRHAPGPLIGGFVGTQCLRNERAVIQIVDIQRLYPGNTGGLQFCQQVFGNFIVGSGDNFTAVLVHHIGRNHSTDQEILADRQFVDASFLHLADMTHGDALILGNNNLARLADDVKARDVSAQAFRHHLELNALLTQMKSVEFEEHPEHVFIAVTQRT